MMQLKYAVATLVLACALVAAPVVVAHEQATAGCGSVVCSSPWWPQLAGEGGSVLNSGQTYSQLEGRWSKVGNIVTATFDIALLSKGNIAGYLVVYPLPFPAAEDASGAVGPFAGFTAYPASLSLHAVKGTNYARVLMATGWHTNAVQVHTANITDTARLSGTITYISVE